MRPRYLLLLLLPVALAVCGSPDQDRARRSLTADLTLREHEQGFLLVHGGDTLAVERYRRTGDSVEGELVDLRRGARLLYNASLGSDDRITRLEVGFYPEGQPTPEQRAVGEFRGDTLVSRSWEDDNQTEDERVLTPPGTLLQIRNSVAMLELALRYSRTMEGDSVTVPVFIVGRDADEHGQVENLAFYRIAGDSVHIYLDAENQLRAEVDGQGSIQGAVNPHNNARVVRLR